MAFLVRLRPLDANRELNCTMGLPLSADLKNTTWKTGVHTHTEFVSISGNAKESFLPAASKAGKAISIFMVNSHATLIRP